MPYITSVERIGIKKGFEQGHAEGHAEGETKGLRTGLLAGIEAMLELKFGADGLALLPEIQPITDLTIIQALHSRVKTATTLDEVRQVYTPSSDDAAQS